MLSSRCPREGEMNELAKSEEASVCWTMNSLGARGLRGRGSYSSSGDGALVGPWLDRHRKRSPWGPPQGVSCPRTQHKRGGCLRVLAGDLLPACPPSRCLDSGPRSSPTLRCLTPIPALWRPSVCAGAVRPSQAAGGGEERGRGKPGEGRRRERKPLQGSRPSQEEDSLGCTAMVSVGARVGLDCLYWAPLGAGVGGC